MSIWRYRYTNHRRNAKNRNIPFLLAFEEWCALWQQSGHWDQYGNRKGQYCMSRPGDKGAYEIGNVRICLNEENRAERNRNYPMLGERNPAYGKNYWEGAPDSRREAVSRQFKGKPQSLEQLTKKAASCRAAWTAGKRAEFAAAVTGRRLVTRHGQQVWAHLGDADYPKANNG